MTSENTFNPPSQARPRPEWWAELPAPLRQLLEEIHTVLEQTPGALPVMGIRALIDRFMLETVGDMGSFEQKLLAMQHQGIISAHDKRRLRVIIDAGNAASHQGTAFGPRRIHDMLNCVEALLRAHWVLGPRLRELEAEIPNRSARPRPPR